MLLNLKEWRKDDIAGKVFQYICENSDKVTLPDQDGINIVCRGKIKILSPKYNVMSPVYLMSYKNLTGYFNLEDYYSKEQIYEAKNKPAIIHFTGYPDRRPWEKGCKHPLKKLYMKYAVESNIGLEVKKCKKTFYQKFVLFKFRWMPYGIYNKLVDIRKWVYSKMFHTLFG